ncbi:lipocalin family protein [Aquabacterium sp.]|uniref:lipocalin family protein n=1 Tax=Aquabacterium sp. TaxID=1872578 RepID=UPI0019CD88D8|nr:lipocalin family protein [Aquabacterium sp.]MBC7701129.1 lipocalin family protein [Aquabacterium sp.]
MIFRPHHLALTLAIALGANAAIAADPAPLQAVESVNLTSYLGRWYQIAHYPNKFQAQCVSDTTADYRFLPQGRIEVTNRCKTATGATEEAVGEARLAQPRFLGIAVGKVLSTAKLQVRFAPALLGWVPGVWAPYWVVQLAPDYRYAVVSEPSREYLWILSRTPTLAPQDRAAINSLLQQQGFELARLQEDPHSAKP